MGFFNSIFGNSNNDSGCSITPFTFRSNQHQRYENGIPVQGLQICPRTITVEKNINGCHGYRIPHGVGYIVKMLNDDIGRPQMSDKPMKIVSNTANKVELRGYLLEAMTPFGYQEIDYADYGFTIYYENGNVVKCVLHMFDRNVYIEYSN